MFTQIQLNKKIISALLAIVIAFSLTACSSNQAKEISLYDLNKAMSEVADFSEMKYASSSDDNAEEVFKNISDMDYSKVDGYFINYAVNGTGNADEIACIRVKNKGDLSLAVQSLNAHLQRRIGLYSTYDKSQVDKLNNAIATSYGNVAVLIVGDNSKAMEKAFNEFMGE